MLAGTGSSDGGGGGGIHFKFHPLPPHCHERYLEIRQNTSNMFGLNGPTVRKFHSQMPMSVLMYYVLNTVLWLIKEEEDSVDDNLNYWLVLCI